MPKPRRGRIWRRRALRISSTSSRAGTAATAQSPAPGSLWLLRNSPALQPARVVMVGDSRHDLVAGRAAGMRTVGVLTGPARAEDLACRWPTRSCRTSAICRDGWTGSPLARRKTVPPKTTRFGRKTLRTGLRHSRCFVVKGIAQPFSGRIAPVADDARRKRAGGRAGNAQRAGTAAIDQMPWRIPQNHDRPTEPLGPEGIQAIHKGAMRILLRNRHPVPERRGAGAVLPRRAARSTVRMSAWTRTS